MTDDLREVTNWAINFLPPFPSPPGTAEVMGTKDFPLDKLGLSFLKLFDDVVILDNMGKLCCERKIRVLSTQWDKPHIPGFFLWPKCLPFALSGTK